VIFAIVFMAKTGNANGEIEADLKYSSRFKKWVERNEVGYRLKHIAYSAICGVVAYYSLMLSGEALQSPAKQGVKADKAISLCSSLNSDLETTILSPEPVSRERLDNLSSQIESLKKPFYELGNDNKLFIDVMTKENNLAKALYTPENKSEQETIKTYLLITRDNLEIAKNNANMERTVKGADIGFILFGALGLVAAGYTLRNGYRTFVPKPESCPAFKP